MGVECILILFVRPTILTKDVTENLVKLLQSTQLWDLEYALAMMVNGCSIAKPAILHTKHAGKNAIRCPIV